MLSFIITSRSRDTVFILLKRAHLLSSSRLQDRSIGHISGNNACSLKVHDPVIGSDIKFQSSTFVFTQFVIQKLQHDIIVAVWHGDPDDVVKSQASESNTVKIYFHTTSYPPTGSHTVDLYDTIRRKADHSLAFPARTISLNILDFSTIWTFESKQL